MPSQEVFLHAFQDQLASLIVNAAGHGQNPRLALLGELGHGQPRVERISSIDGGKKAGRLFEERNQRIVQQKRKQAGTRRRLDQHLVAVRKQLRMSMASAILTIIVDWMIVAGGRLESQELRLRYGAGGQRKSLTNLEVFEVAAGCQPVLFRVERFAHDVPDPGRTGPGLGRVTCAPPSVLVTSLGCRCRPESNSSSM